jgi:hypothetical protein
MKFCNVALASCGALLWPSWKFCTQKQDKITAHCIAYFGIASMVRQLLYSSWPDSTMSRYCGTFETMAYVALSLRVLFVTRRRAMFRTHMRLAIVYLGINGFSIYTDSKFWYVLTTAYWHVDHSFLLQRCLKQQDHAE